MCARTVGQFSTPQKHRSITDGHTLSAHEAGCVTRSPTHRGEVNVLGGEGMSNPRSGSSTLYGRRTVGATGERNAQREFPSTWPKVVQTAEEARAHNGRRDARLGRRGSRSCLSARSQSAMLLRPDQRQQHAVLSDSDSAKRSRFGGAGAARSQAVFYAGA
jgi:hypothetical protein